MYILKVLSIFTTGQWSGEGNSFSHVCSSPSPVQRSTPRCPYVFSLDLTVQPPPPPGTFKLVHCDAQTAGTGMVCIRLKSLFVSFAISQQGLSLRRMSLFSGGSWISQKGTNPIGRHQVIIWHNFCGKLHENEKKWTEGHASLTPPDPPLLN